MGQGVPEILYFQMLLAWLGIEDSFRCMKRMLVDLGDCRWLADLQEELQLPFLSLGFLCIGVSVGGLHCVSGSRDRVSEEDREPRIVYSVECQVEEDCG